MFDNLINPIWQISVNCSNCGVPTGLPGLCGSCQNKIAETQRNIALQAEAASRQADYSREQAEQSRRQAVAFEIQADAVRDQTEALQKAARIQERRREAEDLERARKSRIADEMSECVQASDNEIAKIQNLAMLGRAAEATVLSHSYIETMNLLKENVAFTPDALGALALHRNTIIDIVTNIRKDNLHLFEKETASLSTLTASLSIWLQHFERSLDHLKSGAHVIIKSDWNEFMKDCLNPMVADFFDLDLENRRIFGLSITYDSSHLRELAGVIRANAFAELRENGDTAGLVSKWHDRNQKLDAFEQLASTRLTEANIAQEILSAELAGLREQAKKQLQVNQELALANSKREESAERVKVIRLSIYGMAVFLGLILTLSIIQKPKAEQFMQIAVKDGLRIRSEPSLTGKSIFVSPHNSVLKILDREGPEARIEGVLAKWYKVQYEDKIGWAFSGFLKPVK
jgi:hypothetical protein